MKKENDEITNLFFSRLQDMEMEVKDGFWEDLNADVIGSQQHHKRLLFFRIVAAASVLLVLGAASMTIWYLSPKEEMEQEFSKIAATSCGARLDGDGVLVKPLPKPLEPVLSKPGLKNSQLLTQSIDETEDSVSVTFSVSFTISSNHSDNRYHAQNQTNSEAWMANDPNHLKNTPDEQFHESTLSKPFNEVDRSRSLAVRLLGGTALPADNNRFKMPISAGITIEKMLNNYLGVETGLMYSNLRSTGQTLHYLGIPLKMNVTVAKFSKVDLYATVGGLADKCIAGAPDNDFKHEPIQLALTAGLGINYKLNDRLALFAESGIVHYFKTDSELATVRTERPNNFNLLCGVRMTY